MYLEPCWSGWDALLEKEIRGAMFCAVFGGDVYSIFGILLVSWDALGGLEIRIRGTMFCVVFCTNVSSILGILLVRLGCPDWAGNQL